MFGKSDSIFEYYINWDCICLEFFGMVNLGCVVNMIVSLFGIKLISIESGRVIFIYDM